MTSLFSTLKQLAVTAGMGEDTKIQFSMKPNAGESGFQQWHGAMKMVARLPGGIPREFRKTLWLTLAERHISSKNITWLAVERTCFNDTTNPDDEELGVQIVKDLHRTGCSLFCGTSGEENQAVLKRVLLAYARWNKSVGYCQGFNMLAALILEVMDRCEYNSLKVMIYLIEGVLPESYFANSLRGFSIDMAVFRDLLRLKLPELSKHLEALQTGSNDAGNTYEPPLTNAFTMQWFLTLFCNCLPHSTVLRVWDLIFLEGNQVLLKTALAIWDTLSDRIMPVKSADEFYSIMCVLTREMLEFGLMDANSLIKTISSIELPELTELRERYIYNITPWTQVARNGLRLFYSDDEMDDSDEEANDEKGSDGAYAFLKVATKHGSQSIRSISPSSILAPLANEKEKIALDILALKKQYCKIKERQRQAQIIFTAACSTQEIMGSMMSSTSGPAINHLFLNKNAVNAPAKVMKTQKAPTIPVSKAVQRLKETNVLTGDDPHSDRGVTVYWDKRMKKRKRRRTEINVPKNATPTLTDADDSGGHSDSSNASTGTASSSSSPKSSSSTELCDEMVDVDSEDANTSVSEHGSSPHCRLRSSNLSLLDDGDKSENEHQTHSKFDVSSSCDASDSRLAASFESAANPFPSRYDPNDEHILNVLLTTSIIANEQRNKEKASGDTTTDGGCAFGSHAVEMPQTNGQLEHSVRGLRDSEFFAPRASPSECEFRRATKNSRDEWPSSTSSSAKNVASTRSSSPADIENALEHMKIDALEILLSSQTLESIRNEGNPRERPHSPDNGSDDAETVVPSSSDHLPFQINRETELALQKILTENTEVLKKMNQSYSSLESRSSDGVLNESLSNIAVPRNRAHDTVTINIQPSSTATNCCAVANEVSSQNGPDNKANGRLGHCYRNAAFNAEENSLPSPAYEVRCDSSTTVCNNLPSFDNQSARRNETDGPPDNVSDQNGGGQANRLGADHDQAATEHDLFIASPSTVNWCHEDAIKIDDNLTRRPFVTCDPCIRCRTDDENDEHKEAATTRKRKKYKSLDNLYVRPKSKLKIGFFGGATGKWISISIDNSDLVVVNHQMASIDRLIESVKCDGDELKNQIADAETVTAKCATGTHNDDDENTSKKYTLDGPTNPYLHLNFDIIAPSKKKKDPIEQYVHKKNLISQNYRAPELTAINFNPFPSKSNNRPPKELGVKLGLYSTSNKK